VEAQSTAPSGVYPPRRWPWLVAALVVIAVAGAAVWYFVIRDSGSTDTVHGPPEAPFTVTLPSGWKSLSADELSRLPGSPLAVMQQTEGSGVVIINTQPPSDASITALSKEIQAKLAKKIPDYKLIGATTINLPSGQAASISYARTKENTADTLVVAPAGGRIYTLNAVVPGGQKAAAEQAADIIKSFDA
jgi:predicted Zn-dependent protease